MTTRCTCCGAVGPTDHHHVTGKFEGHYLHPDLTLPLCRGRNGCHPSVHLALRGAGVAGAQDSRTPGFVIGRVAVLLIFMSWQLRPISFSPELLAGIGRALTEVAVELLAKKQ